MIQIIKKYLIVIVLCLIFSCNHAKQEDQISYIRIENNIILPDTTNSIIPLKCSSNFPPETLVVIRSGLRINATDQDLLANTSTTDTLIINQNTFEYPFSASYVFGYISFHVFYDMQNQKVKNVLKKRRLNYDSKPLSYEYTVNYMNIEEQSIPIEIPENPFELKIIRKIY